MGLQTWESTFGCREVTTRLLPPVLPHSINPSLPHSLAPSIATSTLTPTIPHSLSPSLTPLTPSLPHFLRFLQYILHSLSHSLNLSRDPCMPPSISHSLTPSLSHSLPLVRPHTLSRLRPPYSLTHSLAHHFSKLFVCLLV